MATPVHHSQEKLLKGLQSLYPDVAGILQTISFATLFEWTESTHSWASIQVEGMLYLASKRNGTVEVVVKNRASTNDFRIALDPKWTRAELSGGVLMLNSNKRVFGIWTADESALAEFQHHVRARCSAGAKTQHPPSSYSAPTRGVGPGPVAPSSGIPDAFQLTPQRPPPPHHLHHPQMHTPHHPVVTRHYQTPTHASMGQQYPSAHASYDGRAAPVSAPPGGAEKHVLSKHEMQDVLLRLIRNDRFVDLLHAEYLKSVSK